MSPRGTVVALAATIAIVCASHLKAQDVYGGESLGFLEPGTRVRVTTEDSREIGDLAYVGLERFEVYVHGVPV